MISDTLKSQYDSLRHGRGLVELPARTLLELTGADNRRFLHSFCTADVSAMQSGDVKEAFILDTRGKTLALGHLLRLDEAVFLSVAAPDSAPTLAAHLDRYVIRDDVQIIDRSGDFSSLLITFPQHRRDEVPDLPVDRVARCEWNSVSFIAAGGEFAGPAILLLVPNGDCPSVVDQLVDRWGFEIASLEALDMVRLECGTPWYGLEIDESNLPQEVQRDRQAISFTKGCYLGQETVARIDAIGHVNKLLVGVKVSCTSPPNPGQEILVNESSVGRIKSVAFSPALGGWLALAYVKREYVPSDQPLTVDQQAATVVALPVDPSI